MKMRHMAARQIRVMPLAAITLANYAAQAPYYLHNDYSTLHPLPGVRAVALLGVTLAWFALGLAGFKQHRRWGFPVLVSFLVVEAVFYAGTVATGAFIPQMENNSNLIKAIFVTGYASGAMAAYYAYRLFHSRLGPKPGSSTDPIH
jgi:hypothetical protein